MHIVDKELKMPRLYEDKSKDDFSPVFINLSFGLNNSEKLILSNNEESEIVGVLLIFSWLFFSLCIVLINWNFGLYKDLFNLKIN